MLLTSLCHCHARQFKKVASICRFDVTAAIEYEEKVFESNGLIDEEFLSFQEIDFFFQLDDIVNPIPKKRLIIFPRNKHKISSSLRADYDW